MGWIQQDGTSPYRFSAFWLRSKCSICSYQLNIWYGSHVFPSILIWFLTGDGDLGLALALSQVSLVLQYHQDGPLPHLHAIVKLCTSTYRSVILTIHRSRLIFFCTVTPFRLSLHCFQRWAVCQAGRDSRWPAGSSYLPGTKVNHDQVGGSFRLSPAALHFAQDGIYNYLKRR